MNSEHGQRLEFYFVYKQKILLKLFLLPLFKKKNKKNLLSFFVILLINNNISCDYGDNNVKVYESLRTKIEIYWCQAWWLV